LCLDSPRQSPGAGSTKKKKMCEKGESFSKVFLRKKKKNLPKDSHFSFSLFLPFFIHQTWKGLFQLTTLKGMHTAEKLPKRGEMFSE